jgi:hypothetical protein
VLKVYTYQLTTVRDLLTFGAILQTPQRRQNAVLRDPEGSSETSANIYKNTVRHKIQYNYLAIICLHNISSTLNSRRFLGHGRCYFQSVTIILEHPLKRVLDTTLASAAGF